MHPPQQLGAPGERVWYTDRQPDGGDHCDVTSEISNGHRQREHRRNSDGQRLRGRPARREGGEQQLQGQHLIFVVEEDAQNGPDPGVVPLVDVAGPQASSSDLLFQGRARPVAARSESLEPVLYTWKVRALKVPRFNRFWAWLASAPRQKQR
jgi:hypothetical protein